MLLKNKNAVIFGGGGAIGGAVARVFAREGAKVFIAGRTQAKLDSVARDIAAEGANIETAQVDVLDERAVENFAGAVAATAGGIDIALNAVSFMHDQGTLLANLSLETYMHPIDRFLRSLFITSKAVAPHMGKSRPSVMSTLKRRKNMVRFLHYHSGRFDYEEIHRNAHQGRTRSAWQFGFKGEASIAKDIECTDFA